MKKIIILLFIFVSLVCSFLFLGYLKKNNHPVTVTCVEATRGHFVSSISTAGKIISRKKETVKSTGYGIILDSGFQNRDYIKKDSIIAKIKLEERELQKKQQQLKLAEIDLQIIREQREQAEELFKAKAISERKLKELQIRELKQQAAVDNIRDEIKAKKITAAFDGMIVQKKFSHLDRVFSGTELFTLVDPKDISVELTVSQKDMKKLYLGQKVIITNEFYQKPCIGQITEISSVSSQFGSKNFNRNKAATFTVYCSIKLPENHQILFGADVNAEIVLEEKNDVMSIPLEAVLYRENAKIVFVIEKNKAIMKEVITGGFNANNVEIISGLSEGDKIITRGNLDVENGKRVVELKQTEKQHRETNQKSYSLSPYLKRLK